MKMTPSLEEVNQYRKAGLYKVVPVCCELLSDICTPIQAVRKLKNVSSHCFLLESAEAQENWGRYSFLGFDPKLSITCSGGEDCVPRDVDSDFSACCSRILYSVSFSIQFFAPVRLCLSCFFSYHATGEILLTEVIYGQQGS